MNVYICMRHKAHLPSLWITLLPGSEQTYKEHNECYVSQLYVPLTDVSWNDENVPKKLVISENRNIKFY